MLAYGLLAVVAGSLVYCLLAIIAVRRYRAVCPPKLSHGAPISILKPLSGLDQGLAENLRSFFEQDYTAFEILFAVRNPDDPACGVVRQLQSEYPHVASRLIITGEPPYANAKVFSLDRMSAAARHDLLVMGDSDIRVQPDMLATIAAEFQDDSGGPGHVSLSGCARAQLLVDA